MDIATIAHQLYTHNKAKDIGGTIKHWWVVDEARILFNAYRDVSDFGESILTEILTKSRAYGISFLLASQESASFNSVMRSLSFLKIAFPLNDDSDLDFIQASFGLSNEQKDALFAIPPRGTAVVRYGGYEKPFLLEVPFFEIKQKVSDAELENWMAPFYAKIDQQVADIKTEAGSATNVPAACAAILFFLGKYPFTNISGLGQVSGFKSPAQINKAVEWLIDNEYVRIEKYRTSKAKKSNYPVLLEKALAYLNVDNLPGKGSFLHSLYQNLVFEKITKNGYTAKIEGRMKGSNKLIDVLAVPPDRKLVVAFEITLSFSNLRNNIVLDFNAGASEVVIVCRTKEGMSKAKGIIAGAGFPEHINQQIRYETIDAYFS